MVSLRCKQPAPEYEYVASLLRGMKFEPLARRNVSAPPVPPPAPFDSSIALGTEKETLPFSKAEPRAALSIDELT
jgi:hypothetical protein